MGLGKILRKLLKIVRVQIKKDSIRWDGVLSVSWETRWKKKMRGGIILLLTRRAPVVGLGWPAIKSCWPPVVEFGSGSGWRIPAPHPRYGCGIPKQTGSQPRWRGC